MAKDETKRIRPITLQEDRDALSAIKGFNSPAYKPSNDKYTLDKLQAAQGAVVSAREIEVQKQADFDTARDVTVAAEWAFHNAILAAKDQVQAQYGDDSAEISAVGLTKKSERAAPVRTPAAPPAKQNA